jgi:hypothetical protein
MSAFSQPRHFAFFMHRAFITALAVFISTICAAGAWAISGPDTEPIDSPLSRSTASTTTETKPYVPDVKYPDGFTVLYNASRGSKIEPCGCRSLNLGGIDKEAAMIEAIRGATSSTLFLDCGGFFRLTLDPNLRLETWYMIQGLKQLGIQAMNVGYWDLKIGLQGLKDLESSQNLPFISANIIDTNTHKPVFAPYREFVLQSAKGPVRVAVIGVTAPNHDVSFRVSDAGRSARLSTDQVAMGTATTGRTDVRTKWMIPIPAHNPAYHSEEFLDQTRMQMAADGQNSRDGLGGAGPQSAAGGSTTPALKFALEPSSEGAESAPYSVADEVSSVRDLATQLRGNHDVLILLSFTTLLRARRIAEELPMFDIVIGGDYSERIEPARTGLRPTLVVAGDHDAKYLGQVDVEMNAGKVAKTQPNLLPILQSITPLKDYTHYITDFSADTEKLPIPEGQNLAKKIYAGASSCRQCHIPEYTQWQTTKHSHAMKSLLDKQMQFNTDCLQCHVVAYKKPGGFRDLRVTAQLANVQCEVCHGPGQAHIEEERHLAEVVKSGAAAPPRQAQLQMKWDAHFCMQCHNPQNDPDFHFDQDVQRIRHINPAANRIRPTTATLTM